MRSVTYAGGTVLTTDRIAAALVELTAALARRGLTEAVRIPVFDHDRQRNEADLVVGVGVEMLSVAAPSDDADPACDEETAALRRLIERAGAGTAGRTLPPHYDRVLDDPEFSHPAHGERVDGPIPLRPRTRPRD